MKNRNILIIIILLIIMILCATFFKVYKGTPIKQKDANDLAKAEDVVRNHFKWWNEKNIDKLNDTMTKDMKDISWGLENLDSVKIISISEDTSNVVKDGYMKNGKGKYVQPKYVRVFDVKYELNLKDNNKGPDSSGNHKRYYIVIKQDENSHWLIDEMEL